MSKKSIIEREKKRNYIKLKYVSLRHELKSNLKVATSFENKLHYQFLLQKLPRNSSSTRNF
jgi:hypothetical protein